MYKKNERRRVSIAHRQTDRHTQTHTNTHTHTHRHKYKKLSQPLYMNIVIAFMRIYISLYRNECKQKHIGEEAVFSSVSANPEMEFMKVQFR
jgi:hypothetical protein